MKKQLTFAMLALLVLSAVSCGGSGDTGEAMTTAGDATATTAAETSEKITWKSTGIESKDYEGRTFTFIREEIANDQAWYHMAPAETNGETLNDKMFQRNQTIEDAFHIEIMEISSSTANADFKKAITSGDTAYDVGFLTIPGLFTIAQEGGLVNWYDLPNVNLDAEWWDRSVIEQLTLQNQLYFCTGDISPATNVRVYSLVFNKDLCRELSLELPYEAVLDGKWTIDLFNQYITNVNRDINGDGVMDYDDRWGYFSQDGNSFMMFFGGGGRVVEVNEDGKLEFVLNSDANISLATKAMEITIDASKTLMADPYVEEHGGSWANASSWFAAGGSLMRSSVFEPVPRDYRSMDTDFGVLPYPKLDEDQETYYTLAEQWSIMLSVPTTADAEYVGTILEVLAAESVSTVSPAFYDVCLEGKSIRDNESAAVLDILFANKLFDYALIDDSISNFQQTMRDLEAKKSTDVASKFASMTKKAEKRIEKLTETLSGLES